MSDVKKVMQMIKEKDVKYVDFRFTDPSGKTHHIAQYIGTVDEEMLTDGIMFDGSSIAGWKDISESDMQLRPDLSTVTMDPFAAQPLMIVFCDVIEPSTGQPYNRDPRSIAKKAVAYLDSTGTADTIFVGPEAEFFVFDDVRYSIEPNNMFFSFDQEEGPPQGRLFTCGPCRWRTRFAC